MKTKIKWLLKERTARRIEPSQLPASTLSSGYHDFIALISPPGQRFDWRHHAFEMRVVVRAAYGIKKASSAFFSVPSCVGMTSITDQRIRFDMMIP